MFLYEAAHVAFCYNYDGRVCCLAVQGRQLSENMKRGGESYGAQQRLIGLKTIIQATIITSVNNLGIGRCLTTLCKKHFSAPIAYKNGKHFSTSKKLQMQKSDLDSASGNLEEGKFVKNMDTYDYGSFKYGSSE